MSIIEVKVPQLSESVAEATLLAWRKKVGEAVTEGEILIDIETDKVVLEVPAPNSGVLTEMIEQAGATVAADQVIAKIDTEAKAAAGEKPPSNESQKTDAQKTDSQQNQSQKNETANVTKKSETQQASTVAMPSAAKILAEKNLTAADVEGTGRGNRVTKGDALNATQNKAQPSSQAIYSNPIEENLNGRPDQRVPMSRLRARIAERLIQSQQTTATLTTFNEVNMKAVMDLRAKYKDKFEKEHGVRLGFMSFFVKAVVQALKKYPILNASVDGSDIVYHNYFDMGIAVGSPRGLVVPIMRNADQMNFVDIEKKIAEFGDKAKEGKLTLEDLTGGTFSISNGGVFGSMLSTPIINPPQSAILGIHATKERPVVENGEIVIRPMNYLALSYDHRIIDGREAVLGLVAIKDALEEPARLLLDV